MNAKNDIRQIIDHALIGQSPPMQRVKSQLTRLASMDVTTLIVGDSGTGKELAARLLHQCSRRASGPWIAINCGAIPSDLFESELFGHTQGAFTGAQQAKHGLFAAAQHGTVFLDEIGEMPLLMQVKLLRVLQERCVRPVGATQENEIDIRIIAASHQPLAALVEKGHFRLDLYHRLAVAQLYLPSLSEVKADLPELCHFLIAKVARNNELQQKPITIEAIQWLTSHLFKGNIRELEHGLLSALIWSKGPSITVGDLESIFSPKRSWQGEACTQMCSLGEALRQTERAMLHQALHAHGNNIGAAARQLGISERSLRYRVKKYQALI